MGRLLLIRHAQASFLELNYDKLSAIGETQALRLGQHWTRQKMLFDGVCSGPRVRHRETAKIVGAVYRDAGLPFPEPVEIPEFDEYQAEAVLKQGLPQLAESNNEVRKLHGAFQNSTNPAERLANFEKMFEMLITKWVDGELVLPAVESWPEFCDRADRGLSQYMSANGRGQQLAVFCSAGLIGVAMRRALHLSSQDTLRTTWMVRNSAFSEFLFSNTEDRFSLGTFNSFPHLDDVSLLTYR
jgi:broad specificity phosphatase PhoE